MSATQKETGKVKQARERRWAPPSQCWPERSEVSNASLPYDQKSQSSLDVSYRSVVRVNVNGRVFDLSHSTCIRIPVLQEVLTRNTWKRSVTKMAAKVERLRSNRSYLSVAGNPSGSTLFSGPPAVGNVELKEELFFQRNSTVFAAVVDYVQNNELHVPSHVCPKLFARDLNFWGFDIDEVEACCFPKAVHFLWERQKVDNFHNFLSNKKNTDSVSSSRYEKLRSVIWDILDEPYSSQVAQVYFYIMCIFIVLSFCVIAADTVDSFRVVVKENGVTITKPMPIITTFSNLCAIYLYVDFTLRLTFCPRLMGFFMEITNVTDALAVLSNVAWMVLDKNLVKETEHPAVLKSIHMLKVLRIMRLLRPMSKMSGFRLIFFTIKCSFHELLLVLMLLGFLTMLFATMLYYMGDKVSFKSIPHAMWFSLTTMTTVGYGDIIPHRLETKIIGSVVAVFGIIMMSMTMPIMVSNFNSLYHSAMMGQPTGRDDDDVKEDSVELQLRSASNMTQATSTSTQSDLQKKETHGPGQKKEVDNSMRAALRRRFPKLAYAIDNVNSAKLARQEEEEEEEQVLPSDSGDDNRDADDENEGEWEGEESPRRDTEEAPTDIPVDSNIMRHRMNVMLMIERNSSAISLPQLVTSLRAVNRLKRPRSRRAAAPDSSEAVLPPWKLQD